MADAGGIVRTLKSDLASKSRAKEAGRGSEDALLKETLDNLAEQAGGHLKQIFAFREKLVSSDAVPSPNTTNRRIVPLSTQLGLGGHRWRGDGRGEREGGREEGDSSPASPRECIQVLIQLLQDKDDLIAAYDAHKIQQQNQIDDLTERLASALESHARQRQKHENSIIAYAGTLDAAKQALRERDEHIMKLKSVVAHAEEEVERRKSETCKLRKKLRHVRALLEDSHMHNISMVAPLYVSPENSPRGHAHNDHYSRSAPRHQYNTRGSPRYKHVRSQGASPYGKYDFWGEGGSIYEDDNVYDEQVYEDDLEDYEAKLAQLRALRQIRKIVEEEGVPGQASVDPEIVNYLQGVVTGLYGEKHSWKKAGSRHLDRDSDEGYVNRDREGQRQKGQRKARKERERKHGLDDLGSDNMSRNDKDLEKKHRDKKGQEKKLYTGDDVFKEHDKTHKLDQDSDLSGDHHHRQVPDPHIYVDDHRHNQHHHQRHQQQKVSNSQQSSEQHQDSRHPHFEALHPHPPERRARANSTHGRDQFYHLSPERSRERRSRSRDASDRASRDLRMGTAGSATQTP